MAAERERFTLLDICQKLPKDVTKEEIETWVEMMQRQIYIWVITDDVYNQINVCAAKRGAIINPLIHSLIEYMINADGDEERFPYGILGHIWVDHLLQSYCHNGHSLYNMLLHWHTVWKNEQEDRFAGICGDFSLACRFETFQPDLALFQQWREEANPETAREKCGVLLEVLPEFINVFRPSLVELARSLYPEQSAGPVRLTHATFDYYRERGIDLTFAEVW